MLPNFLCIGVQKAGTTTLHDLLSTHPEIYLPGSKETGFFIDDRLYKKGLAYYEATFFPDWSGEQLIGEINPSYVYHETAMHRIHESLGEVRFILIFRDPVDRAYSHYNMNRNRGIEREDFLKALELEPQRLRDARDIKTRDYFSYIARGRYAQQMERWLTLFPLASMFFMVFEEFITDQHGAAAAILNFLGVRSTEGWVPPPIQSNPAAIFRNPLLRDALYKPMWIKDLLKPLIPVPMRTRIVNAIGRRGRTPSEPDRLRKDVRERVTAHFIEDIQRLEKLISRDLSVWYRPVSP